MERAQLIVFSGVQGQFHHYRKREYRRVCRAIRDLSPFSHPQGKPVPLTVLNVGGHGSKGLHWHSGDVLRIWAVLWAAQVKGSPFFVPLVDVWRKKPKKV